LFIIAWGYDIWELRNKGKDCSNSLVDSSEYNIEYNIVSLDVSFNCCDFEIR